MDANNNLTDGELQQQLLDNRRPTPNPNAELKKKVEAGESAFFEELHRFMNQRGSPISRMPNLGFKKSILNFIIINFKNTYQFFFYFFCSRSLCLLHARPGLWRVLPADGEEALEECLRSNGLRPWQHQRGHHHPTSL